MYTNMLSISKDASWTFSFQLISGLEIRRKSLLQYSTKLYINCLMMSKRSPISNNYRHVRRSDWLGCGVEFAQIENFKKLDVYMIH